MERIRVLHLEDDLADSELIQAALKSGTITCEITLVQTRDEFHQALLEGKYDLILSDYKLPNYDGISALQLVQEQCPDIPFIFVSGTMGEDAAIETLTSGATDYVLKQKISRLAPATRRALDEAENRRERKQAEDELRRLKEFNESIVQNIAEVIVIQDAKGVFTFVNPAVEVLLGYGPGEILGQRWISIVPPDQHSIIQAADKRRARGKSDRYELELKHKNGGQVSVLVSGNPLFEEGHFAGSMSVLIDITELKRAEEQNQRQLQRLHTLHDIDQIISSSFNLRFTLDTFLDQVTQQLRVDAADVLLYNSHAKTIDFAAGRGFKTTALQHTNLSLNQGHAGKVALERHTVVIPDLSQNPGLFSLSSSLNDENFVSYFGVPLIVKGQLKGVLEIFHREKLNPDPDWLHFLETMAGQAAIAIDSMTLFENLQKSNLELSLAYESTLEGWARALELRDKETQGHSRNVTEMTVKLSKALGINDSRLGHIRRGALLHDIGKMGIPDNILHKPGALTEEEWEIMRQHPVYAFEMLSPVKFLQPALDIPHFHHEKWDGTGYPLGLKGTEIPLAARIFSVVDVWDALHSSRSYRSPWAEEDIIAYIREESGTHLDPQIVAVFLKLIEEV